MQHSIHIIWYNYYVGYITTAIFIAEVTKSSLA